MAMGVVGSTTFAPGMDDGRGSELEVVDSEIAVRADVSEETPVSSLRT